MFPSPSSPPARGSATAAHVVRGVIPTTACRAPIQHAVSRSGALWRTSFSRTTRPRITSMTASTKRARSHASWPELKALHAGKVPKFVAVCVAFVGLFDECPPKVRDWIAHGDAETNRSRLSFAMGVQSLWQWKPIGCITTMMREPLGLDAEEFAALKAFSISAGTALPEL